MFDKTSMILAKIVIPMLLVGLLLSPHGVQAQIYKHVDENGKVTYSDKPGDDAEKVHLKELNVAEQSAPKQPSWNDLLITSEPISVHFSFIPADELFNIIALYAKKADGIIVKQYLTRTDTMAVKYLRVPWAEVVQDIADKHGLAIKFSGNTVLISDSPSYLE